MPRRSRSPDDDPRHSELAALALRIGHRFQDPSLLDRALCHASLANDGRPSYERLEFLGDAILNFLVAEHLFRRTPEIPEGQLTDRRSRIVSRDPLAAVEADLGLASHLDVGRGLRDDERGSSRIRADLVEAVLGAVYLDGGIRAARKFVRKHVLARVKADPDPTAHQRDSKGRLLHHCQVHRLGQPTYRIVHEEGPAHRRTFTVEVALGERTLGTGTGRTRRAAEFEAAAECLQRLHAEANAP
ncbi:MAG: ribonuclease III [Planctomycetes bacterium]|nr:ribonuclease III [Planctomycetota bacterium]